MNDERNLSEWQGHRQQAKDRLKAFIAQVQNHQKEFMGYQTSQQVDFPEELSPLLNMNLLNIGDAFADGQFTINAKSLEREVLDYYAKLWHAPNLNEPNSLSSYWGYMTTMGSTEGNFYGLWNAREYLRGNSVAKSANTHTETPSSSSSAAKSPVLLCSQETHYSVFKAAHILDIPLPIDLIDDGYVVSEQRRYEAKRYIPSNNRGEIDLNQLIFWANYFYDLGHGLIFALNIGSTFKGAFDPVQTIVRRLGKIFNRDEQRFWIHIDAAICGNTLPAIETLVHQGELSQPHANYTFPVFDFRIPEVSSICCSPYKWIGAPWPFGIFINRANLQMCPPTHPKYLDSQDTTLAGSRNGLACAYSWYYYYSRSESERRVSVLMNEKMVQYAFERLHQVSNKLAGDGIVFSVYERTSFSPIIYFSKPSKSIIKRFSLPIEDDDTGEISHIVVLPHVTQTMIDALCDHIIQDGVAHV